METNSKLSHEDSEASEKLVDSTPQSKLEITETGIHNNGDTMINIAEVSHAFVGMGKEELMKFANDPFWVKLRWCLFALFWLMWLGMLAAAIGIIFFAPKCAPPQRVSWKFQPIYQLNLDSYISDNTEEIPIKALEKRLDYLADLGVASVLINSVMKSSDEGFDHVVDYMDVDPRLGSIEDMKSLLKSMKDKGIQTFLKIIPDFSSIDHEWFNKSANDDGTYKDYYIWAKGQLESDSSGTDYNPPNNWVSVEGGSAWSWDDTRKQFYLHQFKKTQPDLNFRNQNVVQKFSEIFKHWLTAGFSGIHLDKVEYLIEDDKLQNEVPSQENPGAIHDQYSFYSHTRTKNQDETLNVLQTWGEAIKNSSGLFSVSGLAEGQDLQSADIIFRPLGSTDGSSISADDLKSYIHHNIEKKNQTWLWELDNLVGDQAFALDALFMLLPGTCVVHSGVELGKNKFAVVPTNINESKDNATSEEREEVNFFNNYKKLLTLKKTLSSNQPNITVENSQVILLTKVAPESPGYIYLFNPSSETATLQDPLPKDITISDKINVFICSKSFREKNEELLTSPSKESLKNLTLPPNSYALIELNL